MASHLEGNWTRDLRSTESGIPKPRDFQRDYSNQGEPSHSKTSDAANRTEQTNSGYSMDDSWVPRLATEKELGQLKHELPQLKATLEKNEAELQHLSGDRNKILAQRDELMNMVKHKEALTLKSKLDEFQQALKFPEDGLLDTDPLKKNLENCEQFLQELKRNGVNIHELEGSLGHTSSKVEKAIKCINNYKVIKKFLLRFEQIKKKNGIGDTAPMEYKEEVIQIKDSDDFSNAQKESSAIYNRLVSLSDKSDIPSELKKFIEEASKEGPHCSQLNYAMCNYLLNSAYRDFKDFPTKVQSKIGEQVGKLDEKTRDQPINKLDEDINKTLETIIGPKQGKKQKQATRIKQAEGVLKQESEKLDDKIRTIQHENDNLKKEIHQLEDPIGEYVRYHPKGSKAKFKKFIDDLEQIYNQEVFEGVKNALNISTKATDARSNH